MTEIMNIHNYLKKMKSIQKNIIEFIEKESTSDEDFQNLIKDIDSQKYEDDGEKTRQLLLILNNVSENHHRDQNFIQKARDNFSIQYLDHLQ